MFKDNELEMLSNCLGYNISYLENYLDQYKGYLAKQEIKDRMKEVQELKELQVKTEYLVGNKALEKILE